MGFLSDDSFNIDDIDFTEKSFGSSIGRIISYIIIALCFLLPFIHIRNVSGSGFLGLLTGISVFIGGIVYFCTLSEYGISKYSRRKAALRRVHIYLAPYTNIFNDLKITNKFCQIKLEKDGNTIVVIEKTDANSPMRTFTVLSSRVYNNFELFNMFCKYFDSYTTYDGLIQKCYKYKTDIIESTVEPLQEKKAVPKAKRIDINNCSEAELQSLPGINIIMAKKIIKKREAENGFKNINEFFVFLNLAKDVELRLRELVTVNEIKQSEYSKKYNERTIDF